MGEAYRSTRLLMSPIREERASPSSPASARAGSTGGAMAVVVNFFLGFFFFFGIPLLLEAFTSQVFRVPVVTYQISCAFLRYLSYLVSSSPSALGNISLKPLLGSILSTM